MKQIGQGKIVAFYHHNEICYGLISEVFPENYLVSSLNHGQHKLPAKRFILISDGVYQDLEAFYNESLRQQALIDLSRIVNTLIGVQESFHFEEICKLLQILDDHLCFALYSVIRNHPDLFAFKHDSFIIRSGEEQERYQMELQSRSAQKQFYDAAKSFIDAVLMEEANPPELSPAFRTELIQRLKQDLIEKENSDLSKLIRTNSHGTWEDQIYRIRLALNDIYPLTDKVVAASGLPVRFHLDAADLKIYGEDCEQCDLREDIHVFSIDDEDTQDIDDAFSWETNESGYRLGIYIADVRRQIPHASALFLEAKERVSSLYLPTENIPMFPEELTNHQLSLLEGNLCPVLSLYVDLDKDFQQLKTDFVLSTLRITKNYNYNMVDKNLALYPFPELLKLKNVLTRNRNHESESENSRFTYQLKLKAEKVELKRIDNESPSRSLVRELMILYNRSFAEFTFKHEIPAIYRNIEQYYQDTSDPDSAVVSSMAYLSTRPDYHPGIGAEAYMHASSPIRRFTDLLNQYQVCSFLRKQSAVFSETDLQQMIQGIEKTLLLQREVINSSYRQWFLVYLIQAHQGEPLKAKVIKHVRNGFIAELRIWNRKIHVQTDSYCHPGEEILIIPLEIMDSEASLRADVIQ